MARNDNRSMGGHECIECGEFIAADSVKPQECPHCGANNWSKVPSS